MSRYSSDDIPSGRQCIATIAKWIPSLAAVSVSPVSSEAFSAELAWRKPGPLGRAEGMQPGNDPIELEGVFCTATICHCVYPRL